VTTPPKPNLKLVSSRTIPPKRPKRDLGRYRHAAIVFAGLLGAGLALAFLTGSLTIESGAVALVFAAVLGGSVLAGPRKVA
jgi:hypothetical protein